MTAPDFISAFMATMANEGYMILENVPGDRGGETFSGISRPNNPNWPGWVRVDAAKALPDPAAALKADKVLEVLVQEFYRAGYWTVNRCDELLDQRVSSRVFDFAVNLGNGQEGRYLQRALNATYPPGRYFPPLTVDGQVGDSTVKAVAAVLGHESAQELANALSAFAAKHYIELAEAGQQKFFRGWLRRVAVLPIT